MMSLDFFIVQEIIEFNAVDNQIAEIATSSSSAQRPATSDSLWWDEELLYLSPKSLRWDEHFSAVPRRSPYVAQTGACALVQS